MSGYPNPYKLWCGSGFPASVAPGRQQCINFFFPGSLNGILGRGSTAASAQAYPIAAVQTNLRWDERSSNNARDRRRLRTAANNINYFRFPGLNLSPITEYSEQVIIGGGGGGNLPAALRGAQTPFRAMMNAGDPNLSHNSNISGGSGLADAAFFPIDPLYTRAINQVSSTRRASNAGWKGLAGGVHTGGQSIWTGNQKFVYDGSDYVTFKKLQAKNRAYNDPTFGGDQHHASQVALARVRH